MAKLKFAQRLKELLGLGAGSDEFFDDLADGLVEGDVGAVAATEITDALRKRCREKHIDGREAIRAELKAILGTYGKAVSLAPDPAKLNVFLVLGVNGVGKTTTVAKLADYYRRTSGISNLVLAAADTFRAAAIDQLRIHGERLSLRVVGQERGSDAGAVIYDAIEAVKARGPGLVIADTAGRMHTKANLVKELEKIDKVVAGRLGESGVYKKILVIDATTGQNGLRQVEAFHEAVGLDAVVLTKYDSTAKGGIAIAVPREFGIPVAFVGTGEGYGDIAPFVLDSFLDDFLGE